MGATPDCHTKGDCHLHEGRISQTDGTRLTYGNLALFRPELFADCQPGRYPMVPLLRTANDPGRVSGELFSGRWHNIGTVGQLQALDTHLRGSKH